MKKNSVIIGGSRGIGLSILKKLKLRKDKVVNISRSGSKYTQYNIKLDLSDLSNLRKIKEYFKRKAIHNLIFCQKYRGTNDIEEFKVMVESTKIIIDLLKNNFVKNSSVVILSSIASNLISDQNISYHICQSARIMIAKFYAVKFKKKIVRFNCVLPSKVLKIENINYFKKNKVFKNKLKKINPLKNISTADDIADAVIFLTSNRSKMINGISIIVDGGQHLINQEEIFKL